MSNHTGEVIEAQVDYLTCSAHGEQAASQLHNLGDDLVTGAERLGNTKRAWWSMGYVGFHAGQFSHGLKGTDQAILVLSGQAAEDHLFRALSIADNVSRIDLAVTWRAAPPDPMLGKNTFSVADLFWQQDKRRARPEFHGDSAGGYTCSLGDRRSPFYGRHYNKEAERRERNDEKKAKHYEGCWRYEVEVHDAQAKLVAAAVAQTGARALWIQEWVWEWWDKHGVPPAFPPSGQVALVPGFHRRSDDETRLRHLTRNVKPTVMRLRSHGREEEVRESLGFPSQEPLLRELKEILVRYGGTIPLSGPPKRPPRGKRKDA